MGIEMNRLKRWVVLGGCIALGVISGVSMGRLFDLMMDAPPETEGKIESIEERVRILELGKPVLPSSAPTDLKSLPEPLDLDEYFQPQ